MPARTRPALYRDVLERALKAHEALPLRAEQHGNYGDLFVDTHQLEFLRNPDWQLLFGRRGTGKTFLFGMLEEESKQNDHVLTLGFTAQDFIVSPPVGKSADDRTRALAYFQSFVDLLVGKLTDCVEDLLRRETFLEALRGNRRRTLSRADELLITLLDLARDGRAVPAFDEVEYEQSSSIDERVLPSEGRASRPPGD